MIGRQCQRRKAVTVKARRGMEWYDMAFGKRYLARYNEMWL
jgi:hypothetical protein